MTRPNSPLLAGIDVGTNSVLLTIAESQPGNRLRIVEQKATTTRLGQGVEKSGVLHPAAKDRTLECLRHYRSLMDDRGVLEARAVGTSALRDAQGGELFVNDAETILGFPLEIISGDREAELTFRGSLNGLDIQGPVFVFDIGGGSTELILGHASRRTVLSSESLQIGSVRLTERFELSDLPSPKEIDSLRETIRSSLDDSDASVVFQSDAPFKGTVVGVAGTVTTLAAIELKMEQYEPAQIHGFQLSAKKISQLSSLLASMTLRERVALPGLAPGRADVIVAGAIICDTLMRHLQVPMLTISDRGVRFGLLDEMQCRYGSH